MVLSVLMMTMGAHKTFEHYVNEAFRKKARSKVIDRSKGAEVVAYLGGENAAPDAHFKYWVKCRGFQLMDYPALGLKQVLCSCQEKGSPFIIIISYAV